MEYWNTGKTKTKDEFVKGVSTCHCEEWPGLDPGGEPSNKMKKEFSDFPIIPTFQLSIIPIFIPLWRRRRQC